MGQCFERSQPLLEKEDRVSMTNRQVVQEQARSYINVMTSTQLSELQENENLNISQFKLLKTLGRGTYGKIFQVTQKSQNNY